MKTSKTILFALTITVSFSIGTTSRLSPLGIYSWQKIPVEYKTQITNAVNFMLSAGQLMSTAETGTTLLSDSIFKNIYATM